MTGLIKYDAACRALSEAKTTDEVKDIRDRAEAMRAYARQAKNKDLETDAAEIRIRAERRLGELIAAQKAGPGLAPGGQPYQSTCTNGEQVAPTLADAGIDRKLSSRAQKMAAVPPEEFEQLVAGWRGRIESENERVTTNLLKAGARASRDERLAAQVAEMPDGEFGVIYADPAWRFEPYSRDTGMDRAADNHYPTMDLEGLKEIEVPAAKDCALFMWATAPMLIEAIELLGWWGFEYKTHLVWEKDKIGTGYWARSKHELLLIATKGNVVAPEMGTQPASVIPSPVGAHSEKPAKFRALIEDLFPNVPKLEMFARQSHEGWEAWGNEVLKEAV